MSGVNLVALEGTESTLLYLRLKHSIDHDVALAVLAFYENALKAGRYSNADSLYMFDFINFTQLISGKSSKTVTKTQTTVSHLSIIIIYNST